MSDERRNPSPSGQDSQARAKAILEERAKDDAAVENVKKKLLSGLGAVKSAVAKVGGAIPADRKRQLVIGLAGLLGFLFLVSCVSWLLLRDTWEADNKARLLDARAQCESAVAKGQYAAALSQAKTALGEMGDRKLVDPALRSLKDYLNKGLQAWPQEQLARKEEEIIAAKRQADELRKKGDEVNAYKKYEEIAKAWEGKKVQNFDASLARDSAEQARKELWPRVSEELDRQRRAEEARVAELRRQQEEERRLKRELAKEEAARRKEEEQERQAEERKKAVKDKYKKVPPSAGVALNAVKRLQAKVSVGALRDDYQVTLGNAAGEVQIFAQSKDGKEYPELASLLASAIGKYKAAGNNWDESAEPILRQQSREFMQKHWQQASEYVRLADELVNQ